MSATPSPAAVAERPVHVGVVFGGASGEHAVSIRSAATVLRGLRTGVNADRYRISCFYIDRRGCWWPPAVAEAVLKRGRPAEAADLPAHDGPHGLRALPEGAAAVEVWFPVLHGPNGEDGTIQGLFSLMAVPFVGSGVLGSAVGMDKQAMKAAFAAAGLPQVPYCCVQAADLEDAEPLLQRLEDTLGYPCFVKPANMGSSVGISKATDRASLLAGLRLAANLDPRLVVERGVQARELECAVLGGEHSGRPLRASVLGEICFNADWYDYDTKYSDGTSHTVIPAQVPPAVAERARAMALEACRAVAASGLARVDFFLVDGGELFVNEINTLPGFTSQSMYPMLWEASDCALDDLVHTLVQGARESRGTTLLEAAAP
ncbi:MAG: D-alanine--D-alanine ligase family protein [Cyanobacteriota bacterium]|nr:D-alanine--D-alanine ligase family protein [Cyanobacteriota bacterium]